MSQTPSAAARAEALGEKIAVTFEGAEYAILPTSEWDYEVLEAFEEGRIVAFLRALLGDEQHSRFRATKPKIAAVTLFMEEIQKALGISGN